MKATSVGDREIGGEVGNWNKLDNKNARRMHGNARVRFFSIKRMYRVYLNCKVKNI